MSLRIFRSLKPVIAAVNGAAVGVGVTMQLPMDIRLASTDARFGFVFARRGITPEAASSWFLSRVVGVSTALEWCYTGRVFSAQEAHEWGMVNRVLPLAELMPAALETARTIADNAPIGVRSAKAALEKATELDRATGYDFEIAVYGATIPTEDRLEGVRAFNEKRKPDFKGR